MEVLFYVWFAFRVLFICLLIFFILSGLDDLLIDLIFYVRSLFRFIFRRRYIKPLSMEQLLSVPEKYIAIMVPAWDESAVIGHMIQNTLTSMVYEKFFVFVGTYRNDEATQREVQKMRETFPNVEMIVTPIDGPTNKADCLNWILQGINVYAKDHNITFDIFLMHDAEDVVYPLSLLYYNYLIPRFDFIQIPVFPFATKWYNFTNGVYMDEFAENHTKEMRVRELVAHNIPSAGVGTALSRKVLQFMADERDNQVFDISSITEDYLMGMRLRNFPGKKIFLQQTNFRDSSARTKEPIATREFFPGNLGDSIRQKSRWILGIALQGWSAGWTNSLGGNYFLFRDRKAVASNLMVILGYLIVIFWIFSAAVNRWTDCYIPPLVTSTEPYAYLVWFVLIIFVWRGLNRIHSSWVIYGPLQGLLAFPRLFYANIINFCATWLAIKRFLHARRTGTTPPWGKTAHAFPSEEQLRGYHRRLGDILLERRMINSSELDAALTEQAESGEKLGEILMGKDLLSAEDLSYVLNEQQDKPIT